MALSNCQLIRFIDGYLRLTAQETTTRRAKSIIQRLAAGLSTERSSLSGGTKRIICSGSTALVGCSTRHTLILANNMELQRDAVKRSYGRCHYVKATYADGYSASYLFSSSVIEDIIRVCKAQPSVGYAYFFFDSRNSQSEWVLHDKLMRSLISQFSHQRGCIPAPLAEMYGNGDRQPSIGSLQETLRRIIQGFNHAYIMIDSLDECTKTERIKLLNWIDAMTCWKMGKLHLLVTSRPERDIKDRLDVLVGQGHVSVAGESVNRDIGTYIDARLSGQWDQEIQEKIKDTLIKGADGM